MTDAYHFNSFHTKKPSHSLKDLLNSQHREICPC